MTRIVLPQMVERKNGAIINISSLSAAFPTPLLTVYAGSKSYVDLFSQGLNREYGPKGITVQCILPGHVVSNMSKIRRSSINVPTPDIFVRSALSRLGIDARTTGYWAHDVMLWFIECVPKNLLTSIVHGQMKGLRARALKKKEKKQNWYVAFLFYPHQIVHKKLGNTPIGSQLFSRKMKNYWGMPNFAQGLLRRSTCFSVVVLEN